MLPVFFQDISLRDCLQYLIERDSSLPIALMLCARLPLTEIHHVPNRAGGAEAFIKIFGPAVSAGAGA